MEVEQLKHQGTLAATPRAGLDAMLDPHVISARGDRDWRLVEALRLREATAAEHLVATFGDRAYRLAIGITGNQQDAEEAVQDAFWKVVSKIDTFRGESSLRSWIYRITANAAYEKRRASAHRRDEISLDDVLPLFDEDGRHAGLVKDWSSSVDDPAAQAELRAVLSSAVSELPAHYQAVIVLRDVDGLSMAEVADALGITGPTAKSRAHRARLLLRKRLSLFMASVRASVDGVAQEEYVRGPSVEDGRRQDKGPVGGSGVLSTPGLPRHRATPAAGRCAPAPLVQPVRVRFARARGEGFMRQASSWREWAAAALLAVVALVVPGCSLPQNVPRMEALMIEAGFGVKRADTPERLEHLKTLTPLKLVRHDGAGTPS
jgi:RNA polymerase sigma-70 factor (ECF subfamily)